MNLFATHPDPLVCASWLDDKRVGTALKECCQMMSTALRTRFLPDLPDDLRGPTKSSHPHHPVTLWVGASRANFDWCLIHAHALWHEHQKRYGTVHGSGFRLKAIGAAAEDLPWPAVELTPFQNSARHEGFGVDFSHLPVHDAYRQYLEARFLTDARPATWRVAGGEVSFLPPWQK